MRTLERPVVNCEINLILTWSENCVSTSGNIDGQVPSFAKTDTKLYVPVITVVSFTSWGSLAYKKTLSVSGWWYIKLINEFAFPNPESPIINILHGSSGICDQFGLCSFMIYFVTSSKLIIFCIVFLCYYI